MSVEDQSAPQPTHFQKSPLRPTTDADFNADRVTFRLSKSPAEIERELLADQDEDWSPFVLGAANAALLLFGVQALAAVIVGHNLGAVVEIRFWYRFVPYIAFVTDRTTFVGIVTWSTAVATAGVCLGVLFSLVRNRETRVQQLRLLGWSAGLLMAGMLVIFQFVRHLIDPPVINGWVSAQATAFLIVTALIFVAFKPATALPEPLDAAEHERLLREHRRKAPSTAGAGSSPASGAPATRWKASATAGDSPTQSLPRRDI